MQETLDRTRDDVVVKFGATDRAERLARTAAEDVREVSDTIRAMQRRIMRLETDVGALKEGNAEARRFPRYGRSTAALRPVSDISRTSYDPG
nr:hypothetical protein [uncultured Rhodopila sp.]